MQSVWILAKNNGIALMIKIVYIFLFQILINDAYLLKLQTGCCKKEKKIVKLWAIAKQTEK